MVYLIKPAELRETNIYKIGMSHSNNLKRVNSYLKGTKHISIQLDCQNPLKLEKLIKDAFTKKFELYAGKEYFKCLDEQKIKNYFEKLINDYKLEYEKLINEPKLNNDLEVSDTESSDESDEDSSSDYEPSDDEYNYDKILSDVTNKIKNLKLI